jgi:hypothetical protein
MRVRSFSILRKQAPAGAQQSGILLTSLFVTKLPSKLRNSPPTCAADAHRHPPQDKHLPCQCCWRAVKSSWVHSLGTMPGSCLDCPPHSCNLISSAASISLSRQIRKPEPAWPHAGKNEPLAFEGSFFASPTPPAKQATRLSSVSVSLGAAENWVSFFSF